MDGEDTFRIQRVLNNNVVIVRSAAGREEIWMGRGIGFGVSRGQALSVADKRIEKRYAPAVEDAAGTGSSDMQNASEGKEQVAATADLIRALLPDGWMDVEALGAIADHAVHAVSRLRAGVAIDNPFVDDTRLLYPDTWQLAERIARALETQWQVIIPDEEVGFLALHLRAAKRRQSVRASVRIAQAVQRAASALRSACPCVWSSEDPRWRRLLVELERAFERIVSGDVLVGLALARIEAEAAPWLKLAQQVLEAGHIGVPVPREEVAHLALWLARSKALASGPDTALQ
jgi:transcriptional antiterminator